MEVNTLGLTVPSPPNVSKMRRDMNGSMNSSNKGLLLRLHVCIDTFDTCVISLGSQFVLVNKSQLDTICLINLILKSAQVSAFLANQQPELLIRVLNLPTQVISMLYFSVMVKSAVYASKGLCHEVTAFSFER